MSLQYEELYQRNIGIFTQEEQQKLRAAKIFVAGTGGVGGIQAAVLARMGVGEISIMDPGIFDEPDMNRQYAAMASTIGKNKALATAKILEDIAPFTKINYFTEKLNEKDLLEEIKSSTLVLDAIDLTDFRYKVLLAQIAKREGKYNLSCPIPDIGAVLMIFDPNGMSFEEFTKGKSYPPITAVAIQKHKENLKQKVKNDENVIPYLSSIATNSAAAALSGALVGTEAALIITGKRKPEEFVTVPKVTYVDLLAMSYKIFNPFIEL
jgi:molybdopterin/thiamine biosynthesis adenylyltransferase